jgi:alanine-glyoxylate transaminase / serine-glyoxylate transaminase / serine-pyruvate transaminase
MLFGPGPSDVHPRVLQAMSRPVVGHLDPQFLALLDEISDMLRSIFRTRNDLTFAVSGTGSAGMECALVNLIEPGDLVAVGVAGLFGERLAEIARRCGAKVSTVEVEWGDPVSPDAVEERLKRGARLIAVVHAETSTGMRQPLDDIASLCRAHRALLVVDAVTSLAGLPVDVDSWGVAVCYSGTQKCLSVPPGLAPITFSEIARERIAKREASVGSWYLDTTLIAEYLGASRRYHHTAPISMLFGLHEGLRLVLEEGLEPRWERHQRLGARLHAGLEALGFSFVAREGFRLPQLAAVYVPDGVDDAPVRRRLLEEFGIEIGGGAGRLAGRAWRIGLMGESCRDDKLDRLLEAIGKVVR